MKEAGIPKIYFAPVDDGELVNPELVHFTDDDLLISLQESVDVENYEQAADILKELKPAQEIFNLSHFPRLLTCPF